MPYYKAGGQIETHKINIFTVRIYAGSSIVAGL